MKRIIIFSLVIILTIIITIICLNFICKPKEKNWNDYPFVVPDKLCLLYNTK